MPALRSHPAISIQTLTARARSDGPAPVSHTRAQAGCPRAVTALRPALRCSARYSLLSHTVTFTTGSIATLVTPTSRTMKILSRDLSIRQTALRKHNQQKEFDHEIQMAHSLHRSATRFTKRCCIGSRAIRVRSVFRRAGLRSTTSLRPTGLSLWPTGLSLRRTGLLRAAARLLWTASCVQRPTIATLWL
jgi:hypothetical protein